MTREFKIILCPTDFSEESYHALEYAERFAREHKSKLLLAHIVHVQSGDLRDEEGHRLTMAEAKSHSLAQLTDVQQKRLHGYPDCEALVEVGQPAEHITALASQRNVDLIVIATHGHSSFEHILVGSVAEEIIRNAPCPVFVVRRGAA